MDDYQVQKQKFCFFCNLFVYYVDIEEDFKTQLQTLVPEIFRFDNENFIKEINGEQITSTDLFEYFRVSNDKFNESSNCSFFFSELLCCIRFRSFTIAESYA